MGSHDRRCSDGTWYIEEKEDQREKERKYQKKRVKIIKRLSQDREATSRKRHNIKNEGKKKER